MLNYISDLSCLVTLRQVVAAQEAAVAAALALTALGHQDGGPAGQARPVLPVVLAAGCSLLSNLRPCWRRKGVGVGLYICAECNKNFS
jgi:hypothetical protein